MSEPWLMVDSGACVAAFNMAFDEALLHSAHRLGKPVLRFYGWTQPAASFGYSQKIAEVEGLTTLRPLIRRPTGGGIVPHDADWTYSVVIPSGHEWHRFKAEHSYLRMHAWLRNAFKCLDIETRLAEEARKPRPGECFVGHELHDLLWKGHKIAGAAQRRTRTGLLIQGSIQPPPLKLDRQAWQQAMRTTQPVVWQEWVPDEGLRLRCKELLLAKYGNEAFLRKR